MKTFKIFLAGFALCGAVITFYAFVQETKPKVYDYVTISWYTGDLFVSYGGDKSETIKGKNNPFNYNNAISFVNKLEKEGYVLYNNNSFSLVNREVNYFMLRREHKE